MIKAQTLDRISIYKAAYGEKTGETLPKGLVIFATDKINQFLKLVTGGWVSMGNRGQYVSILSMDWREEPPPTGDYPRPARIRHYHERWKHRTTGEGLSYIAYKMHYEGWNWAPGDPAAVPFVYPPRTKPVRITPQMEQFIFKLLQESAGDVLAQKQLLAAYSNLLRSDKCYNNKTGWNNGYQSVILGANIGAEMMRLTGVICTGAMVQVLGPEQRIAGKNVLPVLALNNRNPASYLATYEKDIFTIHAATNSVTAPRNDPYHPGKVDPWPILGDVHRSTPFPIFSDGTDRVYIESAWIELLPYETNTRLNPYYLSAYGDVAY